VGLYARKGERKAEGPYVGVGCFGNEEGGEKDWGSKKQIETSFVISICFVYRILGGKWRIEE